MADLTDLYGDPYAPAPAPAATPDIGDLQTQLAAMGGPAELERRALELRVGNATMQDRSEVPFTEDPRAMFRTVAGLAGIPGMATAGLGALGTVARAVNAAPAVERMFSGATIPGLMGSVLGIGTAAAGEQPTQNALTLAKLAPGASFSVIAADAANLNPTEFRAKYGMLPEAAMSAWEDRQTRNPSWYKRPFVTHPDDAAAKAPGKRSMLLDDTQKQAWFKPKPRPTGAGDRRDKILRDAEDEATRTG